MKFDMGRAWNDAVALLRANQHVVLIVAAVFFFLPNLALSLLMPETAGGAQLRTGGEPDVGKALEAAMQLYAEIWWLLALVSLFSAIGMLGLLALLTDRRRPTVGEALKTGVASLLTYIASGLLTGLLIGAIVLVPVAAGAAAGAAAAALLGVLAAVLIAYVWVKFSLVVPVIVMEHQRNPVRALKRSWALTKGNSLRLFGFYLLLIVAFAVIAMVLGIVGAVAGMIGGEDAALFVNALIGAGLNMAAMTVYLAVLASAHRQLSGDTVRAAETFE